MDPSRFFHDVTDYALRERRAYLSDLIRAQTGSIVQHGILKGFAVPATHWADLVSSAYILGTYEVAVCAILDAVKGADKTLVDLGGADGVFGIGLVGAGAFGRSVIFEIDHASRTEIEKRASGAGLADRIVVCGEATAAFPDVVGELTSELSDCVVLCDIEGAEFDLFDEAMFEKLRHSHVIIECHEFFIDDPAASACAITRLKQAAARTHHAYEIKDGLRDMRNIPLLANWSDWDVWLTCVEVRNRMMTWLWFEPANAPIRTGADIDHMVVDYQRRSFSG